MISITRKGESVNVSISVGIPTLETRVYTFPWTCSTEEYAGLLTEAIQNQLGNVVEQARREAYSRGWQDAKAKKAKETWFSRRL
jgi:hypothetical protein